MVTVNWSFKGAMLVLFMVAIGIVLLLNCMFKGGEGTIFAFNYAIITRKRPQVGAF